MTWVATTGRRLLRMLRPLLIGIAALLASLVFFSAMIVHTAWFQNYVRANIISVTEESTGGHAEIGAFRFELWRFHAHVDNFVLHGTEPRSDAPLFKAQAIDLRLKLLAGLK